MEHEYRFESVGGHIILLDGRSRLLVDTGAPESAATSGRVRLGGDDFEVGPSYLNVTPSLLGQWIGTEIDALVGVDILNQYDMEIDPSSSSLRLSDGELPLKGMSLGLDQLMGIPILEAGVESQKKRIRMFFDTGARLSYLAPSLARQFPTATDEEDFYPGLGRFTTQTHCAALMIGTERISLTVGILPPDLQPLLTMANTSGILGTAILETHDVCFAPRRRLLSFWQLTGTGTAR